MKQLIGIVVLLISFTAAATQEKSSLQALKALPGTDYACKQAKKEFEAEMEGASEMPSKNLPKAAETLLKLPAPTEKDLETIRTALQEDSASAFPYYLAHTSCPLPRQKLSHTILQYSATTPIAVLDEVKRLKYETLIDAMVDISILKEIFKSKFFKVSEEQKSELEKLEKNMREYSQQLRKETNSILGAAAQQKELDKQMEIIRQTPEYKKDKAFLAHECLHSGEFLSRIRVLATKVTPSH